MNLPSNELLGSSQIEIHYKRPPLSESEHITCAENVDTLLRKYINHNQLDFRECFWVILLTNANRVLAVSETSQGTSRGVLTNTKYIFQLALLTNASAIIVAHNHPSGNLNFSERDISETKKIKRLATLMDISLLDHIVITSESFVSMAEENEL
ncbi:JAB domain-containing protein [Polaribacter sp. Hel1_85]|uniref:JAB domain-containing protein n=1 Tax=Polaribacter sp. Hel1_85 TaxID=1250005 RepID=UPI00052DA4A3|nr:JAB domain-containing protein [Polaribacter sp. Hel1_85]KGL59149.1 DNA repair protein RadC [Polaribacter sp. Hel1_85]